MQALTLSLAQKRTTLALIALLLNIKLSKERAAAVRQDLIDNYGIEADRIQSSGVGSAESIATNDTAEGRAQNRRVEVILEAQDENN